MTTETQPPSGGYQKTCAHEGYVDAKTCIAILFPDDGLSLRHFRKLQAAGFVTHLKLGRRTLFNPSEVLAELERRCKRRALA